MEVQGYQELRTLQFPLLTYWRPLPLLHRPFVELNTHQRVHLERAAMLKTLLDKVET